MAPKRKSKIEDMYKDIISYELAEGVSHEHLLEVAKKVVDGWMKQQEGFVKWEICKDKEGAYTDIVHWVSKEAAKAAEAQMANLPNAVEWMGCYKQGSISTKNLTTVVHF